MIIPFEDLSFKPTAENIESRLKICFIMLQRDLENKYKFPPLLIRPSGIYTKAIAKKISEKSIYDNFAIKEEGFKDIYKINLESIWEKHFVHISFPFFKLLYYSNKSHAENILKDKSSGVELLDKISKLRSSYNPRQICEFTNNVKNTIHESYDFGKKIIHELFSLQSSKPVINKTMIEEVAKKVNLSPYSIMDFLNAIYSYYKKQFENDENSYAMLNSRIEHNLAQKWWKIKNKYLLQNIHSSLIEAIDNSVDYENKIIFPMSLSSDSSYSKTLREIKLFEILEKFSVESYSGMESKAFVKINSIKILRDLLKDKKYENGYIKTSKNRHYRAKQVLKDFFFTPRTHSETRQFIEENFLIRNKKSLDEF